MHLRARGALMLPEELAVTALEKLLVLRLGEAGNFFCSTL